MTGSEQPGWRSFYKPPSEKELEIWRILRGAIAVNSYVAVFNPTVKNECPFCKLPDTIFHSCFECYRLLELFNILKECFEHFNEVWSKNGIYIWLKVL